MKKLGIVLAVALVLGLVACGAPAETSSSAPPPAATSVSAAEQTLEGTVADASMNTLTLQTEDGSQYLFGTEDVPVEGEGGIVIGATVEVHFTGELAEGDEMQQVTVSKIVLVDAVVNTVAGYVTDASMNTLQIKAADGKRYLFSTMDVEVDAGSTGLLLGDAVEVDYIGTLSDSADMQAVQVVLVKVTQAPESSISGAVTDASMNSLEIRKDGGSLYRFSTQDAYFKTGANGLIVGDEVRIYFTGTFNEKVEDQTVTVDRVVVTKEVPPPPAPASSSAPAASSSAPSSSSAKPDTTQTLPPPPQEREHMVSGTVADMTMNALSLELKDGRTLLFPLEDADLSAGGDSDDDDKDDKDGEGIVIGDDVSVFYYGTLAGDDDDDDDTVQPVQVTRVAVTGWGGSILTGTVTDATMNAITIQLPDGSTAAFGTEDADIAGGPSGISIGSSVEIHFLGAYVKGEDVQDVTVVQVIVLK